MFKKILVAIVAFSMLALTDGTVFAQDIWVGSDNEDNEHFEVYLDTDSITREGPPQSKFNECIYKCKLKFVNSQGNLQFVNDVKYARVGYHYTTESGIQKFARAWFHGVSRNGQRLESGKLSEANEYYRQAFQHIKNKYN